MQKYMKVGAFSRLEGRPQFGKPALEFAALHLHSVHILVYKCKFDFNRNSAAMRFVKLA